MTKNACLECFELYASFPNKTWDDVCKFVRLKENTTKVTRARKRIRLSQPDALDLPSADVGLNEACEVEVEVRR